MLIKKVMSTHPFYNHYPHPVKFQDEEAEIVCARLSPSGNILNVIEKTRTPNSALSLLNREFTVCRDTTRVWVCCHPHGDTKVLRRAPWSHEAGEQLGRLTEEGRESPCLLFLSGRWMMKKGLRNLVLIDTKDLFYASWRHCRLKWVSPNAVAMVSIIPPLSQSHALTLELPTLL